ncbi:DUF3147 family protein [Sphingomonas sp. BIUV-7]|uniref:DUF3147 family protein n=1 Tax=Sphingomonas natans TaxID=3063330 RepID=A0ABT8Y3R7_9SPHN|nr:DUF3147 family protein [Sphingomonas sp. BIUV-7]MDO6412958.1 DUF3147 family protein [Sphingomonas sp. BIUV-7]
MTAFAVRALLSGLIVALVASIARRSPAFGALVASLPLVSLLAMIWLWRDTRDAERVAAHVEATFWYVLPSLPMFLLIPAGLRHGIGFWPVVAVACLVTFLFYLLTIGVAARFGVRL